MPSNDVLVTSSDVFSVEPTGRVKTQATSKNTVTVYSETSDTRFVFQLTLLMSHIENVNFMKKCNRIYITAHTIGNRFHTIRITPNPILTNITAFFYSVDAFGLRILKYVNYPELFMF